MSGVTSNLAVKPGLAALHLLSFGDANAEH
jgi:hypothetical protein